MSDVLMPDLPRAVQVEVTGSCNLACAMCLVNYRPRIGRKTGAMCFHTFRTLVDALPELDRVTLQGLGEPLLAPDLDRMIAYATARGAEVGFNTNGMLLMPGRARSLVASGLSWLHVSLDGATAATYESIRAGADFERVCANVAGLVEAKRELGSDTPRLSLVFVAMRRNVEELPALVRLTHELGVGRLFVQNLSHSFSDTDPSGSYADIRRFAESEALWSGEDRVAADARFDDASAVAAELGVDLRLPRRHEQEPERAAARGCDWPFASAYVTHRGEVQPCCMVMGADRAVLGRLEERGFDEIWAGKEYREFRRGLVDGDPPDVCRGCSLYRGVF
jgi:radical SAM protein with 4Fe4S-binding SPASM domain